MKSVITGAILSLSVLALCSCAPTPAKPSGEAAVKTPATVPTGGPASQPAVKPIGQPAAARMGGELTLDLGGGKAIKLVLIPAGKFIMGSPDGEKDRRADEGPQREVVISKPFHMGACEVTRGQFAQFISASGYKTNAEKAGWSFAWDGNKLDKVNGASWRRPGFSQTDEHPAVCISHNDAVEFCKWLSGKTGMAVRLPTEAQWEYACRAGTQTTYPWGDDPNAGGGWANCGDQTAGRTFGGKGSYFSWDDGYTFTSPVGHFKANAFGLHDMIGNAWEWCSDWYGIYANANVADPQGPAAGTHRVMRGGCWDHVIRNCRSAARVRRGPDESYGIVGFRVVVDEK